MLAALASMILAVSPVSAYGGHTVWSQRDAATGAFRLMDGDTALRVPERSVPFDADIGPGADAAPVVVYSRCAGEPKDTDWTGLPRWAQATGCRIYAYSFKGGSERALPAKGFVPSLWHDRLAFFRAGRVPQLRLGRVDGKGGTRALPVGNVPKSRKGFPLRWITPSALDLDGSRLAFGWEWSAEGYGHGMTEIRLLPSLNARKAQLIQYGVVGEGCLHTVLSPQLDHGFVTDVRHETCGTASVQRYDIARGRRYSAPVPGDPVAMARDPFSPADTVTLLSAARPPAEAGGAECAAGCALAPVTGLAFKFEPRRHGPLPDDFDLAPV